MLWLIRLSGFFSAFLLTLLLSPSLHSFPPAEAIRSSHHHLLLFHPTNPSSAVSTDDPSPPLFTFRTAPSFPISRHCPQPNTTTNNSNVCNPSLIHVAITLDLHYLRGSIAAVHSILHHTHCPNTVFFHFLVSDSSSILPSLVHSTFPNLRCKFYHLSPEKVRNLISSSMREALEQPLNYARNYLSEMLEPCVRRVVYLDSDLVVVDDIAKLWKTNLGSSVVGAPEYCHANFTKYYTERFWTEPRFKKTFRGRKPCYFNTGVMVMDLRKWRRGGFTRRIEKWMEVQKKERIYELGSLPPMMLVFAGRVAAIDHRWNQHGLGGDNVKGSCRNLHPGPVSLLHWSGSGKPWFRIDSRRPCPLDALWAPYDLYQPST